MQSRKTSTAPSTSKEPSRVKAKHSAKLMLGLLILCSCFSIAFLWGLQRGRGPSSTPPQKLFPLTLGQLTAPHALVLGTQQGSPPRELSSDTNQKLRILDSILASKNDNDSRIDTELRVLSDETKEALRQKYRQIPAEKRNDRGTVIFLLGRNLTTEADFDFMCEVLREPPCFSLTNCSGDSASSGKEDFDRESGEEVTLAYPQMVALQSLVSPTARQTPWSQKTLDCGRDSKMSIVSQKAASLQRQN